MDAIRRDWLAHARHVQGEFIKLTLWVVGGSMVALMSLTGVILQNRLPVDLQKVYEPLGWCGASLLFLMISALIQASAVGVVAVFALDPSSTLTRQATWHATIYWLAWLLWFMSLITVLVGVFSAFDTLPALFQALQVALPAPVITTP
ncbi:hypothetical protein D3C71_314560 [compost metagenome]